MIYLINDLPSNMVGFRATGEITEIDFTDTVMPEVKKLIDKTDKLNYMLVLDTSLKNFTIGAWFKDAIMGVKHLTKWNRASFITDAEGIHAFTSVFSALVPGEFRCYGHKDMQKAIDWTSEKTE